MANCIKNHNYFVDRYGIAVSQMTICKFTGSRRNYLHSQRFSIMTYSDWDDYTVFSHNNVQLALRFFIFPHLISFQWLEKLVLISLFLGGCIYDILYPRIYILFLHVFGTFIDFPETLLIYSLNFQVISCFRFRERTYYNIEIGSPLKNNNTGNK